MDCHAPRPIRSRPCAALARDSLEGDESFSCAPCGKIAQPDADFFGSAVSPLLAIGAPARARSSRPAGFPRLRRPCPAIPNGRSTFDSSRPECANSGHCPTAWRFKSTQGRNSTESGPKFPRLTPLESKARVERAEGRVQRSFAVANSYSKTIDPASKPRDDRHPAGIVEGRRSCVSVSPLCCDRRSTPCGADSRPPAAHRLGLRRRRPRSLSFAEEYIPELDGWIPEVLFPAHQDPQVAPEHPCRGIASSIMTVVSIVFAITPDDADAPPRPSFRRAFSSASSGTGRRSGRSGSSSAPFPIAWPRFRRCGRCRSPTCRELLTVLIAMVLALVCVGYG